MGPGVPARYPKLSRNALVPSKCSEAQPPASRLRLPLEPTTTPSEFELRDENSLAGSVIDPGLNSVIRPSECYALAPLSSAFKSTSAKSGSSD